MPGKEQIVEELGDSLLPNLVNRGLVANDRAKYLMTLLQTAREHADHPENGISSLNQERMACGIEASPLDIVVSQSSRVQPDRYRIPEWISIRQQLVASLQAMLAPVEAAAHSPDTASESTGEYQQRLQRLTEHVLSSNDSELVSGKLIDQITAVQPADGDSIHLLVMHLHKELNRLQRLIASESIDGAQVYGVAESDHPYIAAFMRGVNRTRKLKFDHPGLDTTATRTGNQLVIQNDIGTTDAHVIVIHVTDSQVDMTYTDVHIQRLVFFQDMFKRFPVQWEDTRTRHSTRLKESLYHLCVGRYAATTQSELVSYLEFAGSRLVFLIDWNRARKRLRKLAPKRVGVDVLHWAADQDLGHMAFLRLGGEQLVFDALRLSSREPVQIGGQLSDFIGVQLAAEFLKFTMKTAALGLLANRSELLIRDQVRAELRHYLETAQQGLLELASDHAALVLELATAARDCLIRSQHETDAELLQFTARQARKWEHLADQLVNRARNSHGVSPESRVAAELLRIADDAADDLEEGIFLLTLLEQPLTAGWGRISGESRDALQDLANQLVHTAREYVKVVENARCIHRGSSREVMSDFLEAVDRTIRLEHRIDDTSRRTRASVLRTCDDFKQLHLFSEVNDKLESASDGIMRAALFLRDYVLDEAVTR